MHNMDVLDKENKPTELNALAAIECPSLSRLLLWILQRPIPVKQITNPREWIINADKTEESNINCHKSYNIAIGAIIESQH